jgi:HlyD family secretion protein
MTQNVVMYTVEVNTENPDNVLLPYLTANVKFTVGSQSNVLLVPNAALRWSPSSFKEIAADTHSQNPFDPPTNDPPAASASREKQGVIWLKDGELVRAVTVKTGTSDGADTAVAGDGLAEGQEVVVGETMVNLQSGTKNPFLPPVIRR